MKKSVILIVLIILISSVSFAQELKPGDLYINDILIPYSTEEKCTDGTLNGQCSSEKSKYCNNGILVDNCVLCSCPQGECQFDGTCKEPKQISYVYANGQRIDKVENNEYLGLLHPA